MDLSRPAGPALRLPRSLTPVPPALLAGRRPQARRLPHALEAVAVVLLVLASRPAARGQPEDWHVTRPRHAPEVQARYRAMLERNPDDAQALRKLLEARGRAGLADLIQETRARAAARPTEASLQHLLGHLCRRAARFDDALAAYEAALGLDPARPSVIVAVAELRRQRGQVAEARAAYDRALATSHGEARRRLLRPAADLAVEARDAARARELFGELRRLEPADLALRADWAEALVKLDLKREAQAELAEVERRQRGDAPRRLETLKRLAALSEQVGDSPRALALLREALGLAGRGWQRRDVFERIVKLHRQAETLHPLIGECERTWQTRGFFEWDALARLYEEVGEPQRALAAYAKACAADRTAIDTRERLVRLLDRLGEATHALAEYERLVAVAPGEARYQLELAERLMRSGARPKALALLKRCAARFAGDPAVHASLADLYARWGEQALALRETELLVKVEPNDENHLINLGEHYFQRGQKQRAYETWRRLLGSATRRERGLARLAEVYADHDLLSEAIDLYRKALTIAPADPDLHRGLALVFERQRRADQAIVAWEQVLAHAIKPTQKALRAEARGKVVALLHKSGRLARRLEEYRWRLQRDPTDSEAAAFLVDGYLALGRLEDAQGILDLEVGRDPKNADALATRAKVHRSRHNVALAIADLKRLAEVAPPRARECYEQIAELSFALGRDADALAFARRALELAPGDAQAHARLAELYEKQDDTARAVAEYRRAIELSPHRFPPYFAAARLLGRLGQGPAAAQLYREVVRRATDDDVVLAAGRKALDLEEYLGTLGALERELWPLAFALGRRPVYRRLLIELYDRYAPPLIERSHLGDAAATAELARLGEHGLAPLLEALADRGSPQQRLALALLGHFANPGAAPALMRLGREAAPPAVTRRAALAGGASAAATELRVAALHAAARLGDPRLLGDLLKLADERDVTLRAAAVWGLARQPDVRAQAALVHALDDTRGEVQALACLGLGARRTASVTAAMTAAVADPRRPEIVRAACAHGLGLAGDPASVPALTRLLVDGSEQLQVRAAVALGLLGEATAKGPLLRTYFRASPRARVAITWALARLGGGAADRGGFLELPVDTSGKPDLAALFATLDPPAVSGAARSVIGQADEVRAGLLTALRDPGAQARVLADLAAGEADGADLGALIGDARALPPAEQDALRRTVRDATEGLGSAIQPLWADRRPEVRRRALLVAGRLGTAEARAALARGLTDEDRSLRDAAGQAVADLARRACPTATAVVGDAARGLDERGWPVRLSIALGLAHVAIVCGRPAALVADLRRAAQDPNGFVREAAVATLGHGPTADLAVLEAVAGDEAAEVRRAAAAALGQALRAGGANATRARAALTKLATDPSPAVRAATAAALAPVGESGSGRPLSGENR